MFLSLSNFCTQIITHRWIACLNNIQLSFKFRTICRCHKKMTSEIEDTRIYGRRLLLSDIYNDSLKWKPFNGSWINGECIGNVKWKRKEIGEPYIMTALLRFLDGCIVCYVAGIINGTFILFSCHSHSMFFIFLPASSLLSWYCNHYHVPTDNNKIINDINCCRQGIYLPKSGKRNIFV